MGPLALPVPALGPKLAHRRNFAVRVQEVAPPARAFLPKVAIHLGSASSRHAVRSRNVRKHTVLEQTAGLCAERCLAEVSKLAQFVVATLSRGLVVPARNVGVSSETR